MCAGEEVPQARYIGSILELLERKQKITKHPPSLVLKKLTTETMEDAKLIFFRTPPAIPLIS